ncbi:phosphoenolpyruvate carboxykinase (ATP) [Rickettsiales bacterium]|nr:phosphoenolpyruvate carboxykinase (ATP) [Rickettsiales bacterium]
MATLSTYEYYKENLSEIPPLRAIAETLLQDKRVRKITPAEAYDLALKQWDVMETDLEMYPPAAKRLGLPEGAKVLNNCHGKIVGRTAAARRFYPHLNKPEQEKVTKDLMEAISDMQKRPLIKAEAIVGMDKDLMIKATIIGAEDDASNIFNWLANFTPFDERAQEYAQSKKLKILDIIVIGDNQWNIDDDYYENCGHPQLSLIDHHCNVVFNFGMRYFGERKKGTLTLAWTSGMNIGQAACHSGVKEIDFSECEESEYRTLGKRSIAFFGLSGTGKSSHTNSASNGGTMPKGFKKVVLHDDAYQIDCEERVCRAWEPTLFDKTDSRPITSDDWKYMISVQNHGIINVDGKRLPLGQDIRNSNGRALLDRDILGDYVNSCSFPETLCWLTKDSTLPPIVRLENIDLAVSMGAALMTKRNKAENVREEELNKLVFVPYANPFRVYALWKDVQAFQKVFEKGAHAYCLNSAGFWKSSDDDTRDVPLQTSLALQTAILTDKIEWEDWDLLPGAKIPTKASIDKIIPGFYNTYNPANVDNLFDYITVLKDRFAQRRNFLETSDLSTKPELLEGLVKSLNIVSNITVDNHEDNANEAKKFASN